MSTMEIELNNLHNASDGSPVITGDENEQKSITGLDELLEQELKEDDSVDCFIKRVGDASEDSSEFSLHYDESPVVSSSAFYSPKEASTDNNSSSLEKEFEDTLDKGKEVALTSDADQLQSAETTQDEIPVSSKSVEDTDEGTKEIIDKEEDNMPNKNDSDSIPNQGEENSMITEGTDSEVKEQVNKENNVVKDIAVEDTLKGKEMHDTTEVKLPSEIPNSNTEKSEKDTNRLSAKAENATEVLKDVLYLVFKPQDQVVKINDGGKDNASKKTVQCSETSTTCGSVILGNASSDKPVTKRVLTIAGSSESKNGKEINKSITVKTITAKIIKNGNAVTNKPVSACKVNDPTSGKGSLSNTKSSESKEKQHNEPDDTKREDSEKEIHSDDAANVKLGETKLVLTRKVYGNSKKSPQVLEENQIPSTEDGDAPNMETKDHPNKADHDKDLILGNGPVKNKVQVSTEGRASSDELEVKGKEAGESTTGMRTMNFAAVKRKFEEIRRVSQEEEDAAIQEIKKMKKETLDVLKKINAEVEKLKFVFLAGN